MRCTSPVTEAETTWENVQIPRDRMGRPLVMDEQKLKRHAYRRVTTFVSCLEDRYNLERWGLRKAVWGLAQRPDLILKATSCHPDDKSELDDVAWEAKEYALSSAQATTGTALHRLCERLDKGEKLGRIPVPHADDIKAYERAMQHHGIEHVAVESFRVFDSWKVAGTCDRIVKIDGEYYIADIKTGSIDYPAKFAMQLSMYRKAVPYDVGRDERVIDPQHISTTRGLIIHLPAGEGRCELHWVDIERGWAGCQIAYRVFEWRSTKNDQLIWPDADQLELPVARPRTDWIEAAGAAGSVEDLNALWRETRVNYADTKDFLAACAARKAVLTEQF